MLARTPHVVVTRVLSILGRNLLGLLNLHHQAMGLAVEVWTHKSGLVPRGMAMLGLIGGPLIFISGIAILFGAFKNGSPPVLRPQPVRSVGLFA